jgi:hypothetical protein
MSEWKRNFNRLPFLKNEEDGGENQPESYRIIPLKAFFEIKNRKDAEDHERDNFLGHLQLWRRELIMADAVGWRLESNTRAARSTSLSE